jgi:hypothetical protein
MTYCNFFIDDDENEEEYLKNLMKVVYEKYHNVKINKDVTIKPLDNNIYNMSYSNLVIAH